MARPCLVIADPIRLRLAAMVGEGATLRNIGCELHLSIHMVQRLLKEAELKTACGHNKSLWPQRRTLYVRKPSYDGGMPYHTRSDLKNNDKLLLALNREHPERSDK